MTDEEVFATLGISEATEGDKAACLHNVNLAVNLRALSMMNDLLTEEEVDHVEQMEKNGSTQDEILWWLGENVASVHDMMDAVKRDYVNELAAKR
jgi:hypothetical protein